MAILKLPINTQPLWIRSMVRELKLLIKEKTFFKKELPGPDDPIIPVTAKFRTKIKSDGTIENSKHEYAYAETNRQKWQILTHGVQLQASRN